jgi:hypothetical protein
MRRLLLIMLCLAGIGVLVWMLRRAPAGAAPDPLAEEAPPEPSFEPQPPEAEVAAVAPSERSGPIPDVRETAGGAPERAEPPVAAVPDPDQLLDELARLRAEVVERVERRPLFVMAEQRGVPYFRLFFMTKPELFAAVLEAEGIPPADVRPSPETAERVRELAAEAFRRHDEIAAEEAADLAG